MKDIVPRKLVAKLSIATSLFGIGTLKRVADTMYLELGVVNGDAWPPAAFGISRISSVSKRVRSMRATRGVLLPLMNNQRPSGMPFVCDSSAWCVSSHGMKPRVV